MFFQLLARFSSRIPLTRKSLTNFLSKTKSPDSSFLFQPITPPEIQSEILCIPDNKSHGPYSWRTPILKCASDVLSSVLADIFYSSIELGAYPSKLKMLKIPLFLKQKTRLNQTTASQYLYCLILAEFLKEKMHKRLESLLNGKKYFKNRSQYKFSEKYSTQHAIIDSLNTMKTNIIWCNVFIDVKKTFDTVDHSVLLNKVHQHGFREVINNWFSSYLRNRTHTTQVGSKKKTVTPSGVLQESVLGKTRY